MYMRSDMYRTFMWRGHLKTNWKRQYERGIEYWQSEGCDTYKAYAGLFQSQPLNVLH